MPTELRPAPVPRTWSVLEILRTTEEFFRGRGVSTPRLDAELLLAKVFQCPRIQLYAQFDRPLTPAELDAYRELVRRRAQRYPVHYLLGEREFFSRPFRVSPEVLIPRPETELLVEAAIESARKLGCPDRAPAFLDVGTGCGNVAVTLACEMPHAEVHATDVSAEALRVARLNAEVLGVAARVAFHEGDLFDALPGNLRAHFDFIVSNPPYVSEADLAVLMPEVRDYEPRIALSGGPDGLAFHRRLAAAAPAFLKPGGKLLLEVGAGQSDAVQHLFHEAGCYDAPQRVSDYAGIPRVFHASLLSDAQSIDRVTIRSGFT
ncbi:MAG: peptide chain release factor N(5)-glutamine methyltransferase [Planctomycetes bacterium]|nr:peptide chain release factor N(5)-glutamine methyltransferase [Planctomycetota bacterium]